NYCAWFVLGKVGKVVGIVWEGKRAVGIRDSGVPAPGCRFVVGLVMEWSWEVVGCDGVARKLEEMGRMIPEQGDPGREVPINETFHEQTDDELNEKELK
nr:hypothetical protein [Tanacetum cinerariifolium]